MDLGQAEMGFPFSRQGKRDLYNAGARFQPVDPFTLSIALVTRSRQHPSRIESIDDVALPPRTRRHFSRRPEPRPRRPLPVPANIRSPRLDHGPEPPLTPIIPSSTRSWITYIPNTVARRARSSSGSCRRSAPDSHSLHSEGNMHSAIYDSSIESEASQASSMSSCASSRPSPPNYATSFPRAAGRKFSFMPTHRPISGSPFSSSHSHNNAVRFGNQRVVRSADEEEMLPSRPCPPSPVHSLSRIPLQSTPSSTPDVEHEIMFIPSPSALESQYYGTIPVTGTADATQQTVKSSLLFATDILPRQLYLHFLLRLPSFYFSRVSGIFTEADLTLEEIHEMALQVYTENKSLFNHNMFETEHYGHSGIATLSPAYGRLKLSWEYFIDNLIKEWKTLNIISVLLLSAIMTTFQIHGAAEDPVTRYLAFWSLICALMSLLYSCSFIIQFASMRKAHKALGWAIEAQKMQTILWNVWVMLAMPMVWMTWSILTFIASMMSFMWRARAKLPSDFEFSVAPSTELGFRIFICIVLGLGAIYGALIISTFRRYGSQMDETWTRRVRTFIDNADSKLVYRSMTSPPNSQDRDDLRSMASLPLPYSETPPTMPYSIAIPPQTIVQTSPTTVSPHPAIVQHAQSNYVPETNNSPLSYRSSWSMHPHPGIQANQPPETRELQLRRSKSAPHLPQPLIPDSNAPNKDTNSLLKYPDIQSYHHTSTSSRHPTPSDINNDKPLSRLSERKLRRSASDDLIRYPLVLDSTPVIKDPDSHACSPPTYLLNFTGNCSSSATHEQDTYSCKG